MWDRHDPRSTADRERGDSGDRSRGSRGGPSERDRNDESDTRDVFTKDLDLPRGHKRELVRERDRVYDFEGVRVFVDPKSFIYLHGMILDYEETLMKQGFNFVNPNSSKSCGCGSSFSA